MVTTRGGTNDRSTSNTPTTSSFTIFQVPAATTTTYGNTSVTSTLSSNASFEGDNSPLPPSHHRGFQMGWSNDTNPANGNNNFDSSNRTNLLPPAAATHDASPPPLDESYYTYGSSRGGVPITTASSASSSSRSSFSAFAPPLASGMSISTIGGFTPTDLDRLESRGGSVHVSSAPPPPAPTARGGIHWMRTGRVIRVKDTGESFRFPLDDPDHLPHVALSAAQYATFKRRAELLADQALTSKHVWMENPTLSPALQRGGQTWKVHVDKKNCVVYRQRTTSATALASSSSKTDAPGRKALVRAKLECSLDELAFALNCDNTTDQRTLLAHLYQESFLDAAVLDVHETASLEDPFQFGGVKWLAFQSAVDAVYAVRDLLVVEVCKTIVDPVTKTRVLARVVQPLEITDVPGATERNFGFARTHATWIHLFRSHGAGSSGAKGSSTAIVDASLSFEMAFPGTTTPAWFANRIVSGLYTIVANFSTAADTKYIVKSQLLTEKEWVPNHERPACSVCFKSFNLLRSRHHCRVCAEIMCTSCTMELTLLTSQLPAKLQPETGTSVITSSEKFCLQCINTCRTERRNALLAMRASAAQGRDGGSSSSALSIGSSTTAATASYDSARYHNDKRGSDVYLDERHSLADVRSEPFPPSTIATHNTTGGGATATNGSVSYYGWSSHVEPAGAAAATGSSHRPTPHAPADWDTLDDLDDLDNEVDDAAATTRDDPEVLRIANLSGLTLVAQQQQPSGRSQAQLRNAHERRRQGSDASVGSAYSDASSSGSDASVPRWDKRRDKSYHTGGSGNGMILLEEAIEHDGASNERVIEPIPTSFVKMEESIAAQQALLRSMMREGQKIMMHQSSAAAAHRPPIQSSMAAQHEFLALPSTATPSTIETIE